MSTSVFVLLGLALVGLSGIANAQVPWDRQFLDPHNEARRAVGVGMPDLVWDWSLALYAQKWADHQARTENCRLRHSYGPYGENIYWASWNSTPLDAVKAWVSERAFYNYATNRCAFGKVCGHYTQVVWSRTLNVGCASSACPRGGTYTVCSYSPPGNYIGQRPY